MAVKPLGRLFTLAEYHKMAQAGILGEDDRVELLEGEIVAMAPIGSRHAACMDRLTQHLVVQVGGRAIVRVQNPMRLGEHSEPQPDLALVRPRPDFYIRPGERMNGFREEHGLGDAFVVSFAGVLGYSQDLDVVLDAARILKDGNPKSEIRNPNSEILFLIVGDGVEKARLEAKARQMGLDNVRFLPMQPREKYPAVLHASDASLVTLHAQVRTPVVPSKILSIMAAGRPVVAAMNLDGDGPRLLAEARCGLCVPPEDPRALAEAVLALYRDPALREKMGQSGHRYAEQHLSLEVCTHRYELLQQIARR
ncbi:MAG: glycosyltransferase [Anaerolineae bacterium]